MRRFCILTLVILFLAPIVRADQTPTAAEIVKSAIAKQERDRKCCEKYVHSAITTKIKYDKKMQADEQTITKRKVYTWGERSAEEILSIEEDGELLDSAQTAKQVADLNKEWQKAQEDKDKGEGSKDNFVDPITLEGMSSYDYFLTGSGDSAFAVVPSAVTPVGANPAGGAIDQSVEKLMSYYVVMARSKQEDSRYLNATYWIDAKSYGILRSVFAPAKLPHFVDMLDFRMDNQVVEMNDSLLYVPSRFELKGKAGFLFFKGRFGVIEEYFAYRCEKALGESLFNKKYFYTGQTK